MPLQLDAQRCQAFGLDAATAPLVAPGVTRVHRSFHYDERASSTAGAHLPPSPKAAPRRLPHYVSDSANALIRTRITMLQEPTNSRDVTHGARRDGSQLFVEPMRP